MATATKTNWVDLSFKILSLLILPLLGFGVSMWTEQSVNRERVAQIQRRMDEDHSQIASVDTRINQIALTVQETNGQIRELRAILGVIRDQVSRPPLGGSR